MPFSLSTPVPKGYKITNSNTIMFKDLPSGTTHHDKDACYKCNECDGHYVTKEELHQHLSESIQCSDMDIIEYNRKNI